MLDMNSSALAGVRAKIGRANHHFREIQAAVEDLLPKDNAPKTTPYTYTDRQELIIRSETPQELSPSMPLAIGDYVHNLRSALDHLVFQLALLKGTNPEAARKTAFPIYLSVKAFQNFCDRSVKPFISGDAFTEVEKLQPYSAGNAGDQDVLWVLSQLDIIDKHRLLVVAGQQFRPVHFLVTVPSGETFAKDIPHGQWKPLEDGAEIIRFDLSKAIRVPGKVNVKLKTAKTVKLRNTGLICDEFDLGTVLNDCKTVVVSIVDDFGRKFFGE